MGLSTGAHKRSVEKNSTASPQTPKEEMDCICLQGNNGQQWEIKTYRLWGGKKKELRARISSGAGGGGEEGGTVGGRGEGKYLGNGGGD